VVISFDSVEDVPAMFVVAWCGSFVVSYWFDRWCVVKRAGVGVLSALSGCSDFVAFLSVCSICDLWFSFAVSWCGSFVGSSWLPMS